MARILIIEGDLSIGNLVLTLAQGMSHEAELVADGTEGLARMATQAYDMVISDVHMKPVGGIELLERTRALHPKTRVVLFSSDSSRELRAQVLRLGAMDFLPKPI
jgi:DNA-binding response OmpR family regulator